MLNRFDEIFFAKYVKEGDKLRAVCHRHILEVIDTILLYMFFGVILPAFFYSQGSFGLRSLDFIYLEGYLVFIYFFLLYRIFDWYNDVWLITSRGVVDINWNIYTRSVEYVDYPSIRGVTIRHSSFLDSIMNTGDIVLELEGDDADEFVLFGAEHPAEIAERVQKAVDHFHHMNNEEEEHEEDDRQPFEVLLATLTDMVKEHIDRKWLPSSGIEEDGETSELIRKALRRKSTIDLTKKSGDTWEDDWK